MKKLATKANALPEEIAKLYDLKEGVSARFSCAEFGTVNLTEVTLAFAEQLAAHGYLIKKVP